MSNKDLILAAAPVVVTGGANTDNGKSTFAKNLRSFMNVHGILAEYIVIEKAGQASDCEDIRLEANEASLAGLFDHIINSADGVAQVIEVGGHAFDSFAKASNKGGNTLLDFINTFVVPMNIATKESSILNTLAKFIADGVPPEKIVVVFNMVESEEVIGAIRGKNPLLYQKSAELGFRICENVMLDYDRIREAKGSPDKDVFMAASYDKAELHKQILAARKAGDAEGVKVAGQKVYDLGRASAPVASFNAIFNEVFGVSQ